jgi:hypothetical protein
LAECRRRDDAVVEDARSPSGWAFRTSFHGAAAAYERVLDASPRAGIAYARLARVRIDEPNRQRSGRARGRSRHAILIAYPALLGDTVAYVPWPPERLQVPSTRDSAIEVNLGQLRARFRDWTRVAARSAAAHEALSLTLEKLGFLSGTGPDDLSALNEIRRARALADSVSAPGLLHAEVRQRLKLDDWTGVVALVDSALSRWTDSSASRADRLVGLAAVTGRRRRVESLLKALSGTRRSQVRSHSGHALDVPQPVMQQRARLLAVVFLGSCEEVGDAVELVRRSLRSHVADAALRDEAESAILERPLALSAHCRIGAPALDAHPNPDPLIQLHTALRQGGRTKLMATLRALDHRRRFDGASDIAIDYAFGEARLLLSVGDTSRALDRLELALDALPMQGPYVLGDPSQAAALVRAMELCARLTSAKGDWPSAFRWSTAVSVLWKEADAPLDAVAEEMRAMAASARLRRNGAMPAARTSAETPASQ